MDPIDEAGKDQFLREQLQHFARRRILVKWAQTDRPFSDLKSECIEIFNTTRHRHAIAEYLRVNPIINKSVGTYLLAMHGTIGLLSNPTPEAMPSASRFARLVNMLTPTILIGEGPLGRFLSNREGDPKNPSPISELLKIENEEFPILSNLRVLFAREQFRELRNAVGHWTFTLGGPLVNPRLLCYKWPNSIPTEEYSIQEVSALILVTLTTIECLHLNLLSLLHQGTA